MVSRMLFVSMWLFVSLPQGEIVKPSVVPFFTNSATNGPVAFVIECHNATASSIQPALPRTLEVWFDGEAKIGPGGGHTGGMPPPVAPGGLWRELVVLHPGPGGTFQSLPGVGVRALPVDLNTGGHTIAAQCGGRRSDDVAFFFNSVAK